MLQQLKYGVSAEDQLLGKHALPLRLFTLDGSPATDYHGYPLKTINGVTLVVRNRIKGVYEDIKGFPLVDAEGRTSDDPGYKPELVPKGQDDVDPLVDEEGRPKLIYNEHGLPLTDSSGRPLCNSQGKLLVLFKHKHPISDINGQKLLDGRGRPLGNETPKPLLGKNKIALAVFDEKGFPLTDCKGYPLCDIKGDVLINFNSEGFPVESVYGSKLFDSDNKPLTIDGEERFKSKAKRKAYIKDGDGDLVLLFDAKGYPITDPYGQLLLQINGIPLYYYNEKHSFLDRYGFEAIVIKKKYYNAKSVRFIKDSNGQGGRLFNIYGKPLTDEHGEVLSTAFGMLLLRFDPQCNPVSDWEGSPIYDMWGHQVGTSSYNPFPSKTALLPQTTVGKKEKRLYPPMFDVTSMPLVDNHGALLRNASEKIMVKTDSKGNPKCDIKGRRLYDKYGLPLVTDYCKPLLGPRDQPANLYDSNGYPLTGPTGNILKSITGEYFLTIDKMGFIDPLSSLGPVCDVKGREMTKYLFNPYKGVALKSPIRTVTSLDGSPFGLYNTKGWPVTDSLGQTLFNWNGEALILVESSGLRSPHGDHIYSIDGKEIGEVSYCMNINYGSSLYTKDGQPLTDNQGSPLKTKDGRSCVVFDETGFPVCDLFDRAVYDSFGTKVVEGTDCHPNLLKVIPGVKEIHDTNQVYDRNKIPLLNKNGAVLSNRNGKPSIIFDSQGRPVSDMRGDPIYDERGIPLGAVDGQWLDSNDKPFRLFDWKHKPVTDEAGRTLYDINNCPLVQRDDIGRPMLGVAGKRLYDVKGKSTTSFDFNGTQQPPKVNIDMKLLYLLKTLNANILEDHLTALYDKTGHPLTDCEGKTLVDSTGSPMLRASDDFRSITDSNGSRVFDPYKLPTGCRSNRPVLSMANNPLHLFDHVGRRLTDIDGTPLHKSSGQLLITFDYIGRPTKTFYDQKLYDIKGKVRESPKFDPESSSASYSVLLHGDKPVEMYNQEGFPVTTPKGLILTSGKEGIELTDFEGPIMKNGTPLLDKNGVFIKVIGCRIKVVNTSYY